MSLFVNILNANPIKANIKLFIKNLLNIELFTKSSIWNELIVTEKLHYLLNFIFVILYYVLYEVAYYSQLYSFIRQTIDDY